MTRRQIRETIFKMVFRVEFHGRDELPEQLLLLKDELEGRPESDGAWVLADNEEEEAYINSKSADIISHIDELDAAINERAFGWKTSRMSKVDLTIIRLALYEIRYEDDIPLKVAINEAVELAKVYGTNDSASFVNGILARFAGDRNQ
ncbi:MAG: transcription antitermination factor NusB [Clostridiales bacterium]|nr:transcription antitermination factor NusB [Clostridiales bacterium]